MVKKNNKAKSTKTKNQKAILEVALSVLIVLLIALLAGVGVNLNVKKTEEGYTAEIQFSEEAKDTTITDGIDNVEKGQGEVKVDGEEIKTVESIESNGPVTEVNNPECPEGEECGRGAYVPTLDISTPQTFANQTLGQCVNVDGYFGSQCWDSMAAYFLNYVGRTLSTCGTGAAKGTIADGCWQQNAGTEFTMIWDATQIQPGDIAVYSTGTWGHIGMAMGYYNNGYFTLLGQNQGGAACPGGGSAGNIINLSTRDFIGAFRPNIYIKPEPEPEPEPTPEPVPAVETDICKKRTVQAGETMADIMKECTGEIKWGLDMNLYAQHWHSTDYAVYDTVYDGWASVGKYGLFAGDTIEYR